MSSLFARVFGSGKKGEAAPSPQEAIQRLREIEEMLSKKTDFLEKKIENELVCAKKNASKNKKAALSALKRKKRYEKQLQQIDGTLTTLEMQREALENASTNAAVLKAMSSAAKTLKKEHEAVGNVDDVNDLMDEIAEQQEVANEISEAICNPVGFQNDVDEDELLAELDELEQKDLDEQLLDVQGPDTTSLPSVPTSEPAGAKSKADEESDDMLELAAWAS